MGHGRLLEDGRVLSSNGTECIMKVAIELPEDIAKELRSKWEDIPRHVLESVALEGYRSGVLTESQVRRLLGFETRMEVNTFLNQHGAYYDYTEAEVEEANQAHERLLDRDRVGR